MSVMIITKCDDKEVQSFEVKNEKGEIEFVYRVITDDCPKCGSSECKDLGEGEFIGCTWVADLECLECGCKFRVSYDPTSKEILSVPDEKETPKACPFCGNPPDRLEFEDVLSHDGQTVAATRVVCTGCNTAGPTAGVGKEHATHMWNSRPLEKKGY